MDVAKQDLGEKFLAVFRILVGWIFLWAFFDKLLGLGFKTPAGYGWIDGGSPSSFVMYVTNGLFADFYKSLAGNAAVDVIFMVALLVLGVTLILGITSKLTTVGSIAFLIVMYSICVPPEDNPIIDYRIILCFGLVAVYCLGGFEKLSFYSRWKELSLVKRFTILE